MITIIVAAGIASATGAALYGWWQDEQVFKNFDLANLKAVDLINTNR